MRSITIQEGLGVESLLLHNQSYQSSWFGHLVRVSPGRFPREVFQACPTSQRPGIDPEHAGEIMSLSWFGHASVFPRREVWASLNKKGKVDG